MFKKTKQRLVIRYALVFFILQNFFGASIYLYMHYTLYHQVAQTILEKKDNLLGEREKLGIELDPEKEENHRLVYLLWDKKKKLYQIIPKPSISQTNQKSFSHLLNKEGLQSTIIGGQYYQFINVPVSKNTNYSSVEKVQIVYNLKREREMLSHLLMVIGFGSLLSVFIAILAGIYFANKALIPIKLSWEKQQQFVANASHELRTPLSVMKLNLEHLFRHPDHNIEQESQTIHQTIQEINYLTKMISDLLTLARSDSNQIQLMQDNIQLDAIIQQVVKTFTSFAATKRIQVTADLPAIKMVGDKERLKQLFIILIDNALKYTRENGSIYIKGNIMNSYVLIEIIDNGIGISKEDLPQIFDRYYRGDKSRSRHLEGNGLGLSIAKWIVESHSGKIKIRSNEGEGTHIFVTLPIKIRQ